MGKMRFILLSSPRVVGTKREAKGTPKNLLLMGLRSPRARVRKSEKVLRYQ